MATGPEAAEPGTFAEVDLGPSAWTVAAIC